MAANPALFAPVSGIVGRVSSAGVIIAFLSSWKMTKTTNAIKVYTFEYVPDSDGNLWPEVLPGLSEAKVSCEGVFDADNPPDSNTGYGISNGLYVQCSFILVRATPYGFSEVDCFIDQVEFGADVNNKASTFTFTAAVSGSPGKTQVASL